MTNSKGRKDVHLLVSADIHRLAKIECAKAGIELSRATEALWLAWSEGTIDQQQVMIGLEWAGIKESSRQQEEKH